MSRPVSDTRAGFMESQGAGTQVLASAAMALKMGVPIYGIVALTNTATDKAGRSIPAPGRGLLTTARESPVNYPSPLLDISYRKKQLDFEMKQIREWRENQVEDPEFVEQMVKRKEKAALSIWGNEFYLGNENIAPLRGALAVWGLTIDDLGVASFHGTGTKANDFNESQVTQLQLEHLGRTKVKNNNR
jgi:3-oxoacyl-(acyl-carrier-protein) synthase